MFITLVLWVLNVLICVSFVVVSFMFVACECKCAINPINVCILFWVTVLIRVDRLQTSLLLPLHLSLCLYCQPLSLSLSFSISSHFLPPSLLSSTIDANYTICPPSVSRDPCMSVFSLLTFTHYWIQTYIHVRLWSKVCHRAFDNASHWQLVWSTQELQNSPESNFTDSCSASTGDVGAAGTHVSASVSGVLVLRHEECGKRTTRDLNLFRCAEHKSSNRAENNSLGVHLLPRRKRSFHGINISLCLWFMEITPTKLVWCPWDSPQTGLSLSLSLSLALLWYRTHFCLDALEAEMYLA